MSQVSIDLTNAATFTAIQGAGNANGNGSNVDLQVYKGPITFVLTTSQATSGTGANLARATIDDSPDGTTYTNVSGGAFTAVKNVANASNVGVQTFTFDRRNLQRYVRCPIEVEGTLPNVPVTVIVIGQKERV